MAENEGKDFLDTILSGMDSGQAGAGKSTSDAGGGDTGGAGGSEKKSAYDYHDTFKKKFGEKK